MSALMVNNVGTNGKRGRDKHNLTIPEDINFGITCKTRLNC